MSSRLTSSSHRAPTQARPISSRKGAGYSSGGLKTSGGEAVVNPLEHAADSFYQILKENAEGTEAQIKTLKSKIMGSIFESSTLIKSEPQKSLAKAKEAEVSMKQMQDLITSKNIEEPEFKTHKFTVLMQLASAYAANSMWDEAIHRFQRVLKDREFSSPYLAYLEIGNIQFNQRKYEDAVSNYQMGINHLKPEDNFYKSKFHHCCGVAQVQLRQYNQALSSFETAMKLDPSVKTGYNLVLCHFILSPISDLRDAYSRLLSVKSATSSDIAETDILGSQLHVQRREEVRLIMLASRLVASKSDHSWQEGYDFVLGKLKASKYPEAEGEFEIAFSLAHLNHRNAEKAIEMLRQIRKKDPSLVALAATNLSFLYYLEQDFENADTYATKALEHDKYNAQALVNKGNCLMQNGKDEEARDSFLEAIGVEADCVEALYNLGIVSKLMGQRDESLQVFEKLNRIIPKSPEVVFEISDCYDKGGMPLQAIDWLHRLLNLLPTDPAIWKRLGEIWDKDQNETQAFHCFSESFKYCPSDIDVATWLGTYFIQHKQYESSIKFFERASAICPKEPRYVMMIASCYKYMEDKQKALDTYEKAFQMDGSNKACLEQLIKITNEMHNDAKSSHYQKVYQELLESIERSNMEEKKEEVEDQLNDNPMLFRKMEKVDAPSLDVGGQDNNVEKGRAGAGDEKIFDDMDINIP